VSAVIAAPAAAQGGGLYEPFPEPESTEQLREYVADLPGGGKRLEARLTRQEFDSGAFTAPRLLPASTDPEATRRAGVGEDAGFLDGWPFALAALLAAAALGTAAARRAG
jgi:hypothetical protein